MSRAGVRHDGNGAAGRRSRGRPRRSSCPARNGRPAGGCDSGKRPRGGRRGAAPAPGHRHHGHRHAGARRCGGDAAHRREMSGDARADPLHVSERGAHLPRLAGGRSRVRPEGIRGRGSRRGDPHPARRQALLEPPHHRDGDRRLSPRRRERQSARQPLPAREGRAAAGRRGAHQRRDRAGAVAFAQDRGNLPRAHHEEAQGPRYRRAREVLDEARTNQLIRLIYRVFLTRCVRFTLWTPSSHLLRLESSKQQRRVRRVVRTEISSTCSMLARWRRALVLTVFFLASAAVGAQTMRVADIADLSIEELGNIQITSVSRHAERLSDAPAAIFVITGEDIRRSGATRLPEALRLAPNLEVARVSASSYAISARGFNNSVANKLLVLIDGRIVYTPLFSGVFWDAQDVMLEDIERIEVISGPGATLWGANAVNGVINVITRRASDTQGAFAYAQSGNLERGFGARYGGAMGA